eukprot:2948873-Pleurochrysis_carterae.AAC.2
MVFNWSNVRQAKGACLWCARASTWRRPLRFRQHLLVLGEVLRAVRRVNLQNDVRERSCRNGGERLLVGDRLKDGKGELKKIIAVGSSGDYGLLKQVVGPAHLARGPVLELRGLACKPAQWARYEEVNQSARARGTNDLNAVEHGPQKVLEDVGVVELEDEGLQEG